MKMLETSSRIMGQKQGCPDDNQQSFPVTEILPSCVESKRSLAQAAAAETPKKPEHTNLSCKTWFCSSTEI